MRELETRYQREQERERQAETSMRQETAREMARITASHANEAATERRNEQRRAEEETGIAPTPHQTPRAGSGRILCPQCPPGRTRFRSESALRNHLESGFHQRQSGSHVILNQSDGPEGHGSVSETVGLGVKTTAETQALPSTDLAQWARAISEMFAGTSPVYFSIDIIREVDTSIRGPQRLLRPTLYSDMY